MATFVYSAGLQSLMARRPALRQRIEQVTNDYFPELDMVRFGHASRSAYYDFRSGTIRVTGGSSTYVIGHELVHFMQDPRHCPGAAYPSGERSCDLFLFARGPDVVADLWGGDASYLLKGRAARLLTTYFSKPEGQRLVHGVCAEAVRLRATGKRNYIRWAESEICARAGAFGAQRQSGGRSPLARYP